MSGPQEFTSSFFGMNAEPPNYYDDEVNPKLLLRLEVWHFSNDGRSQFKNTRLADAFRAANLDNWDVLGVTVIEPDGAANRDDFVPIQVDFRHKKNSDNDPNGEAQNHVRELFRSIMPSIIFRFFLDIQSKPHTMSLAARNVLSEHKQRYCQLFIINKLNIRVDQLLTPTGVDNACIDEIVARLSTLPNALSTLSQIVEIFSLYQLLHGQTIPEFSFMHQQDADHVFNVRTPALMNIEELVMVTEELRPLYEANMNQAAAGRTGTRFQEEFADVVGNLGLVQESIALTPQQLYQNGLNLRMGSIMLSRARDFLGPHLERQIGQYETEMNLPKNIRLGGLGAGTGVGGAIVFGGLASNPFTWGIVVACYLGALAAQFKISPISGKNAAIKAFIRDLDDLAGVFDEARRSVVVAVCRDVFNVRLDNLGQHEQIATLKSFGIDLRALEHEEYRESLVESSLDKLMTYYEEMTTDYGKMVNLCGPDLRNANIPL